MATSVSLVLVVTCLASLGSAAPDAPRALQPENADIDIVVEFHSPAELDKKWKSFKEHYGKAYSGTAEEVKRKSIFTRNLETIDAHNRLYTKGLRTYTMGINTFTDLDSSEFLERMTCKSERNLTDVSDARDDFLSDEEHGALPSWVDWRCRGYVTRVRNQGVCGACYAFSAVGSLEGQHRRKTGQLVELSEQNLIDCSISFGNHGCIGGNEPVAFRYISWNDGIDKESSYPYEAKVGRCRFRRETVGATCIGFAIIRGGEIGLQKAAARYGPVSVGITVEDSLQHYRSGIYYEPNCDKNNINHAVVVVGYGTYNNIDYWTVKNSWGYEWGDRGYVLMSRNRDNNCGIGLDCILPVV